MKEFIHRQNELYCEEVPMQQIVTRVGTPVYVYSYRALVGHFRRFAQGFEGVDHLVCYSMKANSNGAILRTFVKQGGGIDVVTGGELERALKAGCAPQKIVFSGVGKSDEEIKRALEVGILQFNVESAPELEAIQRQACILNKRAPIAIRVNPDVDPKTHAYIATGLKKNKFGVGVDEARALYLRARDQEGLDIVGIDCHIGSQLTTLEPIVEAIQRVRGLILELEQAGIKLKHWDIGGGLGVIYKDEIPPSPEDYGYAVRRAIDSLQLKIILEPGRFLVANAGCLVTKVLYNKLGEEKHFTIVDAASNDLMRPALYDAYHSILPVVKDPSRDRQITDVVGPICETGDFFARDRELPVTLRGECLAIMGAGAYGFSMSSHYNSRPRVPEVLVSGHDFHVIRERETWDEIVARERLPHFLA